MGSIIEHQRVARRRPQFGDRRREPRRNTSLRLSAIVSAIGSGFVRRRRVAEGVRTGGTRLDGLGTESRRPDGTRVVRLLRAAHASTVASAWVMADIPVVAAVILFGLLANVSLLSVNLDAVMYSRELSRFELPQIQDSPAFAMLFPAHDGFDVIGEVAGMVPEQFAKLEVSSYTVRPGDTLGAIALRYGLKLDTLISFNQIEDVRRLQIGDRYQIPNRDGLLYTVKRGDSLSSIASQFSSTVNEILDANDLQSRTINDGQVLFVPGARMNDTELRLILGELFVWPTQGRFTSGFGMRPDPFTGVRRFHNGIDLANAVGTPIRAAAAGRVVHIETQVGNYGKFVILSHPGGFQTLYAHMDSFSVRNGQTVTRGQVIGTMGNTGRSTGPHLHFSVIRNGTFVNPLQYLN